MVDYSVSGEVPGLRALLDRIESRSIPTVGLVTCMQPESLTLLQCRQPETTTSARRGHPAGSPRRRAMAAQRNGSMAQWLQGEMAAQRGLHERRLHDERCSSWARAAAKSVEDSGTTSASDEDAEFWCDRAEGPSRGAAAAAREFARFAYWNGKDRPLT